MEKEKVYFMEINNCLPKSNNKITFKKKLRGVTGILKIKVHKTKT